MELSLCMIVKDEQETIGRCLECVKDIADEIIVVDTGSKDHTKEIVSLYTDLIYDFKWVDDFSKARNYSFSKATKDYVMWLDADDVIDEENILKLKELKRTLSQDIDVVKMKYQMGKESDYVFNRERIVKRKKKMNWVGTVHEYMKIDGNVYNSDIVVIHEKVKVNDPDRNLLIYEKMIEKGINFHTRELFYYARELMEHQQYEKAIQYFYQFLKQKDGWIENQIEACFNLATCYELMGDDQKAIQSLMDSFLFDIPRSEILCEIGHIFLSHNSLEQAIYWYELALKNKPNEENGGFIRKDCYDFIPYLQLCVCYDRLGEYEKANDYNEEAGKIKPEHSSYLLNKEYFKSQRN